MLSFFRRIANSKIGAWVVALIGVGILAGFAIGDISNFGTGITGLGMSGDTLAKVGDQEVSEHELSDVLQRALQAARQQRPNADYASIIGEVNPLLDQLIDEKSLMAFADKFGFPISKRLVDAEIAQIPAAKGINGEVTDQSYQQFLAQQHLTDAQVRELIDGELLQRLMLTPVASNPRVPVGVATPYASMLLEMREGEAAIVPADAFKAGLKPTDAQLQQFYAANRTVRYMIPEQRTLRIARIGPDQVASVTASDKEISDYYNQHKDQYAAADTRSLSQVVVQSQATANAIAQRAKAGGTLAAAAAPAGPSAAVSELKDQTKSAYAGVAGDAAAAAVFSAPSGAVVGPIKSTFGWAVVKVESVKSVPANTLDEARAEIAAKLNGDKRKAAIEDMVDKVQNALDQGSNFNEAVAAAKLPVTTTPLITATGASRADASYKLPAELTPVLKSGFEIAPNDPPEVVTLQGDAGYAVVSPGQVVPAAPAPLASIKDQVTNDWISDQAMQRASAAAAQIAAKASGNVSLADAIKAVGVSIPPPRPVTARRLQMADQQGNVSPAMKLLFSTPAGKARSGGNPQAGGFFVIKVNKITPGNALMATSLIGQISGDIARSSQADYAQQFVNDIKRTLKVKRNESAIQAFRSRLLSSGS